MPKQYTEEEITELAEVIHEFNEKMDRDSKYPRLYRTSVETYVEIIKKSIRNGTLIYLTLEGDIEGTNIYRMRLYVELNNQLLIKDIDTRSGGDVLKIKYVGDITNFIRTINVDELFNTDNEF